MGTTLSNLQQLRDRLFEARLSGVREFRDQNGESVVYRSDLEIAAALAAADHAIAAMMQGRRANTIRFTTSKGV